MSDCRNLEPMFAPYVDGEAEPPTCAEIERHLGQCPPCRDRVALERAAREVLVARRESLRCTANDHLRRRCAAQSALAKGADRPSRQVQPAPPIGAAARRSFVSRVVVPFSIAASLLLVLVTGSFVALSSGVELFAAQLAVDHVKCHWFADDGVRPDPMRLSNEWKHERGWAVKVPPGTPQHDLQLIGMRQCGSTEGPNAHIMYRWRGAPLSVYVMPEEAAVATPDEQFVSKAGQEAIIWKADGRTYAVVADASRGELEPIVQYVKLASHSW